MKRFAVVVFLSGAVMLSSTALAQSGLQPFPQHVKYFDGVILPDNISRKISDDSVASFYDQWKGKYIRYDDCSQSLYVFHSAKNKKAACVSEGQGYGMIIVAYMAGYDKNAKTIYDSLFKYYKVHLSDYPSDNNQKNKYLMSWRQAKDCKADRDAVSDGDMDIMYSLLLANAQWRSSGSINYFEEAKKMNSAVLAQEINTQTFTILKGNAVEPKDTAAKNDKGSPDYFDMRSSDFMPSHFKIFSNSFKNRIWERVNDSCYELFNLMQEHYSKTSGLVPDFIVHVKDPKPAKPNYEEETFDGDYFHNACRVPWRVGTDYILTGDKRSKHFLGRMNDWIIKASAGSVNNIAEGYHLNGKPIKGTENFPVMSYVCPFAVAAMTDAKNQKWLNELFRFIIKSPISKPAGEKAEGRYDSYNNTIKMLTLIILSGNYWSPLPVNTGMSLK